MIKRLTILSILFFIFFKISSAQETQSSLMEEVSYVYMEKLVAVAKENYPKVKAVNGRIAVAETAVKGATLSWFNPLSLSYVYSPATTLNLSNPTFFNGYQIAFSLNLGGILQTPNNIKRAKVELDITKQEAEEYLASLTTAVKSRYLIYLQALRTLKLHARANLDARDVYTQTKLKYERGELTLLDYVSATTGLTTSSQAKIDSEVAVLQAKLALEELLGVKLEEVPN